MNQLELLLLGTDQRKHVRLNETPNDDCELGLKRRGKVKIADNGP